MPVYLSYLYHEVLKLGVTVTRGWFEHIREASNFHKTGKKVHVVINCTALGSAKLGGVADSNVYPVRGQMCVVENTCRGLVTTSGTDDGLTDIFYAQQRLNSKSSSVFTPCKLIHPSWNRNRRLISKG